MQATSKVLSFTAAREKVVAKKNEAAKPSHSKWDRDYDAVGGVPAYQLHQVLQAMSVAYQTGNVKMGDLLLAACREENFEPTISLGREAGEYFLETDLMPAITGVGA